MDQNNSLNQKTLHSHIQSSTRTGVKSIADCSDMGQKRNTRMGDSLKVLAEGK